MKYIITESQYELLKESKIPLHIRRRANEETLKDFISLGEMHYPTLCDDFDDAYDYADAVIDYAIDKFGGGSIEDEDYYSDVMDYLRTMCRDLFGEWLIEVYDMTCKEE